MKPLFSSFYIKKMRVVFLFLLGVIFSQTSLYAKHIVGGEITYVCLGNNDYAFTMHVYRDCNCTGNCAELDNNAIVAIYQNTALFSTFTTPLLSVKNILPPVDPCTQVVDVCVEEGIYKFTVNLPISPTSYVIEYQRCCRNETINNIVNPGDAGATYFVEVTPQAMAVCNNSLEFINFPPTVICAGIPFLFDHSASDPDGDQIVYEFCAPKLGGGIDGGPDNPNGDGGSCTGVIPNPPCAPPFSDVIFLAPTYTFDVPMGGNPTITIDPNSGIISGTPNVLGQFVVGVCANEFRDGVQLSTLRRDFQFNVTSCIINVGPNLVADSTGFGSKFYFKLCGELGLTIENNSYTLANIENFEWRFSLSGTDDIVLQGVGNEDSPNWNPTVQLPSYGSFTGSLLLNPGFPCSDTGYLFFDAFPGVNADFSFAFDTCIGGAVNYTNNSFPNPGSIIDGFIWDYDDDSAPDTTTSPTHLFTAPGLHDVTLIVIDEDLCSDTATVEINWEPAPPFLIVAPEVTIGCAPQSILLNNLSFPIDSTYSVFWDFDDGTTSNSISPNHIFEKVGVFDVYLSVTSPIGCFIDTTFENLITVLERPIALFVYDPKPISNFDPVVDFTDLSFKPETWFWRFGTEGVSYKQNPTHTFRDTGFYEVMLVVTHESGCKDTLIQFLDVVPNITYFLPNAFTPNEDGENEFFQAQGYFKGMRNFKMDIFDRWGEQVFESTSPDQNWNGTINNEGNACENGVYVFVVQYTTPRGAYKALKGFVTIVR